MITTAAFCPHPPLLLRELGGLRDPVGDLRAAALEAVRAVTAGAERVVVVGGADESGRWDPATPFDTHRYGTTAPGTGTSLPLSLAVGRRLLSDAGWPGPVELAAARWDATREEVALLAADLVRAPRDTGLLVLGDGSARRSDTAPGYLDERAFPFDHSLAKALADGDAQTLLDLDPALAAELMVLGRAAFQTLAAVAVAQGSSPDPALLYRDDPFGVTYLVGTWSLSPSR